MTSEEDELVLEDKVGMKYIMAPRRMDTVVSVDWEVALFIKVLL